MRNILLTAGLLVAGLVQAGTIQGDEEACFVLARVAVWTVVVRDMGMSWKDAEAYLRKKIDEAKGRPDSIIKDDDDYKLVLEVTKLHYHGMATPEVVWDSVLQACLNGDMRKRT